MAFTLDLWAKKNLYLNSKFDAYCRQRLWFGVVHILQDTQLSGTKANS